MAASGSTRGAQARDRILRAAAEELAESGELEVAAVARRAGVSTGLPYRYFSTRSGLLIAVLDDFYSRLGEVAALRVYDAERWTDREKQRISDWVEAVYADPLAAVVLGGLVGDAEVAAANIGHLNALIEVGARNMAQAQRAGEIAADRDPEFLAAAALGGTHAVVTLALTRTPRPPVTDVIAEVWNIVVGAVGLSTEQQEGRAAR